MALFIDKISDTSFRVLNMKRQLIYRGTTATKILSLQVDGDSVVASCEDITIGCLARTIPTALNKVGGF